MSNLEVEVNLKTGEATIDEPILGKRKVGTSIEVIRDQLFYLRKIKKAGTSPKPALLRDDIRAYECILAQPDPEAAADQYIDVKYGYRTAGVHRTHREVVTELGWWK